ncbi:PIR protein [Plasmodium ovale]|uniref:PIR protein n=1 Tax=Plasmodium ovale TaxID=36330 RepID=A0A1D3KWM9_PLAOA|nr:PIR protein [Plasmodium ovale]
MVNGDEEEIGALVPDEEYASVKTIQKYEEEFKKVTDISTETQKYKTLCESYNTIYFPDKVHSDRCYIISKYLDYIKGKTNEDPDYRCKCLNYVLNTTQLFNTFPGYKVSKLFRAYAKIASKFQTCHLNIEYIKNEKILEKIKKLYELHKAIDKLDNSINTNNGNTCTNAEKFAELYRNTRDDCSNYNNDGYCVELKGIEQYIYSITESEKYTEAWQILKTLIPNNGTFIIVSCIMILGIPFFLYILYKFTPLGSWANTQIQKKKKIWNNIPENEYQLHVSSHDPLNMENSKFNMKYHSA